MTIEVIPCAPGAHIGEQICLGYLKQHLSSGIVLTNYHHPNHNGTLEIDLIVITHRGVWLLEVKHWWGKIKADSLHWIQGERKESSPLTKIDSKAKAIKSYLTQSGFRTVSVVGLVVLTKGTNSLEISDSRRRRVLGLHNRLIKALSGSDYTYSRRSPILKTSQVDQIGGLLANKHIDPDWRIIGNYRLVEKLESGESYQAFEGQHTHVTGRRVRIKRYQIEAIKSQKHLSESIQRFKQDIEALARLEKQPNIVRAYDFLPDPDSNDTYWLILEYIDGQRLQDRIALGDTFSVYEQMELLIPVVNALICCHDRGIIHRNLTPKAIYLEVDGKVKVGDFDFARVPMLGFTISGTNIPLVENKFIAPEQLENPRNADYLADFYSLGAVWYELNLHRPEDEPILISKIETTNLPEEAQDLLKALLSYRPSNRPDNILEIVEWLNLLKR